VFFVLASFTTTIVNPNLTFYGLNKQNQLLRFNTENSSTILSSVNITGLNGIETLLSIDFRPATGQLYGITDASRLYVLNQDTGIARQIGNSFNVSINDSIVSIDFNPTVDRIRLVTSTGRNLRLNPETGALVAIDSSIMNGTIGAIAYSNNQAGSSNTTLFDIDYVNDRLFQQTPPNEGVLIPMGSKLGVNISTTIGFDISPNGIGLASLMIDNASELYMINMNTGILQKYVGRLPQILVALALPTNPVAYSISLMTNSLLIFNPLDLSVVPISKAIGGLANQEIIVGLDFRPFNGQLYALGNSSRIYTINTASGQATSIGMGTAFTPNLQGTTFGFDFNPTVDRIRVVSNTGQNLRLNPITGSVAAQDATIKSNTSIVTAAAYANNVATATSTTLYVLDTKDNRLLIQNPPNDGVLVDVGPLGILVDNENGFDIGGKSANAYALLAVNSSTSLYRVNLTSGAATSLGNFPSMTRALAIGLGF
jgi:hypothetical protein